jgi:hypothetical protein
MAGFGIPQLEIARLVNISDRTLRTRYRRELDTGATEANLRVAQALYTNAVKHNNVAAQIWWTKCRLGWKEPADVPGDGATHFVFEWAPSPPSPSAPEPTLAHEPPTLEARAEPDSVESADTELTISWAEQATEAGNPPAPDPPSPRASNAELSVDEHRPWDSDYGRR